MRVQESAATIGPHLVQVDDPSAVGCRTSAPRGAMRPRVKSTCVQEDGFDRGRRIPLRGAEPCRRSTVCCMLFAVAVAALALLTPHAVVLMECREGHGDKGCSNYKAAWYRVAAFFSICPPLTETATAKRAVLVRRDDNDPARADAPAVHDSDMMVESTSTTSVFSTYPFPNFNYGHPNRTPAAVQALTFRALSRGIPGSPRSAFESTATTVEAARKRCPFAHDPESAEAAAFWRQTLKEGMISLGSPDSGWVSSTATTTRDVFDALDAFGTILTCCPGILQPQLEQQQPWKGASTGGANVDSRSPLDAPTSLGETADPTILPTCGLLNMHVHVRHAATTRSKSNSNNVGRHRGKRSTDKKHHAGSDSGDDVDGKGDGEREGRRQRGSGGGRRRGRETKRDRVGYEITCMFSWALRAARLPGLAMRALHDATALSMDVDQRAGWEREMAMILLQMGRIREATERLETALFMKRDDLRALQTLGAALVVQGSVEEGFRYLREAVDIQSNRITRVFGDVAREEGLDPSILKTADQEEVLVGQQDWMATFLAWALEGMTNELGGSVGVLRRVGIFLSRNSSMDPEVSFLLGRDLAKRGFEQEGLDYLTAVAAPWGRQIHQMRAALSVSAVPASEEDLALAMGSLERSIAGFQAEITAGHSSSDRDRNHPRPSGTSARQSWQNEGDVEVGERSIIDTNGGHRMRVSKCSFGDSNYPEAAFDGVPLLAFADHRSPRSQQRRMGQSAPNAAATANAPADARTITAGSCPTHNAGVYAENGALFDASRSGCRSSLCNDDDIKNGNHPEAKCFSCNDDDIIHGNYPGAKCSGGNMAKSRGSAGNSKEDEVAATATAGSGVDDADDETVSLSGRIGQLFWKLCPRLGGFVAPWVKDFSGEAALAPKEDGGRLVEGDGRVKVVFVSSRFGNYGSTKALAGLIHLLPRDYFEVIIASWRTPADDWTQEYVLPHVGKRPINLVENRTISLERLAKARPDVVVFADASLDARAYLVAFGRVAPVQIALWGHAPTLGLPSIDYYVVPEPFAADVWQEREDRRDVVVEDSDLPHSSNADTLDVEVGQRDSEGEMCPIHADSDDIKEDAELDYVEGECRADSTTILDSGTQGDLKVGNGEHLCLDETCEENSSMEDRLAYCFEEEKQSNFCSSAQTIDKPAGSATIQNEIVEGVGVVSRIDAESLFEKDVGSEVAKQEQEPQEQEGWDEADEQAFLKEDADSDNDSEPDARTFLDNDAREEGKEADEGRLVDGHEYRAVEGQEDVYKENEEGTDGRSPKGYDGAWDTRDEDGDDDDSEDEHDDSDGENGGEFEADLVELAGKFESYCSSVRKEGDHKGTPKDLEALFAAFMKTEERNMHQLKEKRRRENKDIEANSEVSRDYPRTDHRTDQEMDRGAYTAGFAADELKVEAVTEPMKETDKEAENEAENETENETENEMENETENEMENETENEMENVTCIEIEVDANSEAETKTGFDAKIETDIDLKVKKENEPENEPENERKKDAEHDTVNGVRGREGGVFVETIHDIGDERAKPDIRDHMRQVFEEIPDINPESGRGDRLSEGGMDTLRAGGDGRKGVENHDRKKKENPSSVTNNFIGGSGTFFINGVDVSAEMRGNGIFSGPGRVSFSGGSVYSDGNSIRIGSDIVDGGAGSSHGGSGGGVFFQVGDDDDNDYQDDYHREEDAAAAAAAPAVPAGGMAEAEDDGKHRDVKDEDDEEEESHRQLKRKLFSEMYPGRFGHGGSATDAAGDDDGDEVTCSGGSDSCNGGVKDWPLPWAGVEHVESVHEQVVLLEGLGPFVSPPGWGGRLGTGKLAKGADGVEVRRRHLLPTDSRLAMLPIPVYQFHPEFDAVIGMLIDRDPSIHVVVAVEETSSEAFGAGGEFYQHDPLQYASPPVWTEKLRTRLGRRLGDNLWRLHLLPPLDSWDYFALLGAADVVLDPFPVGNLHAAVDAYALGTPVVTLPSRQRAGTRYVQAFASDLGVPASCCAANNPEHYVELASRLSLDRDWAEAVSDIMDFLREWVYLPKDVSGSRPTDQFFSSNDRVQFDRSRTNIDRPEALNGDEESHDDKEEGEEDEEDDRDVSARGEEHVQEWAEFLWRVSRPGIVVNFPLELEDRARIRRAKTRGDFPIFDQRTNDLEGDG